MTPPNPLARAVRAVLSLLQRWQRAHLDARAHPFVWRNLRWGLLIWVGVAILVALNMP